MRIYNSLTRQKQDFESIVENEVKMYVCGVTPYDYAHIGNARPAIAFDTLYRFLKAQGKHVTYVRNFTDVDDKIINAAKAQNDGMASQEKCLEVSNKFIGIYHADMKALNVLGEADDENVVEPRVTKFMDEIVQMIVTLLDKGIAYIGESGDVLYDTTQFADYGKLSGKNLEDLIAGARVEVSEDKKNPTDFVLWKSAKQGEPEWTFDAKYPQVNSGRPGWHIECSAMSNKLLGETFDIHGGGEDLQFPHHDCEIAQSKGACGGEFARYWMHNAFITVDGEKMAKSVGNFTTIHSLLEKYSGDAIRFWMLGTHYRKPVDLSEKAMADAEKVVGKMYRALQRHSESPYNFMQNDAFMPFEFVEAMEDDLNTAKALATLNESVSLLNKAMDAEDAEKVMAFHAQVKGMANVLGVLQKDPVEFLASDVDETEAAEIDALVAKRDVAKAEKDWAAADAIRDELTVKGIVLEDSKDGTTWRKA